MREIIGKKLRELRGKLTQQEVADYVSVNKQTYLRWEHGETSPNPEQFVKLAELHNVSIDEIFGRHILSQGYEITEEEQECLEAYRKLKPSSKNVILSLLLRLQRENENVQINSGST